MSVHKKESATTKNAQNQKGLPRNVGLQKTAPSPTYSTRAHCTLTFNQPLRKLGIKTRTVHLTL